MCETFNITVGLKVTYISYLNCYVIDLCC